MVSAFWIGTLCSSIRWASAMISSIERFEPRIAMAESDEGRDELGCAAEARGDDPKRALKAARRDRAVAQALHEFNVKLRKDTRVDPLVLPLRDGLTVATLT